MSDDVHICIGFYPNFDCTINHVRDADLKSNIEYNRTYRPGRAYFVDGKHICGGMYTGEKAAKYIAACEEKIKNMGLTKPDHDSRPYH